MLLLKAGKLAFHPTPSWKKSPFLTVSNCSFNINKNPVPKSKSPDSFQVKHKYFFKYPLASFRDEACTVAERQNIQVIFSAQIVNKGTG